MLIADKYKLNKDKLLGKGAYSNVYLGYQVDKDNMKVAIKIINTSELHYKVFERLDEELKIMRWIKKNPHPNIIKCLDVTHNDNFVYIIMEYCENGILSTILKKPMKEKYANYYFKQLISGLQYLKDNKIIHRDIKPSNILLTNKRRILKITDFGFAKNLDDVDFELVCGSPLYMAPELIRDKKCSEGADLWSIGLILYQMLYGFHPFSHCRNIKELFDSVSNTLIEITPKENISKQAIELMDSLLKKKQSNRIKWEELFNHKWITIKPQRKYSFEDSDKAEKSDKPDKDESEMVKSTVDTYVSTRTKSKPIPIGGKRRSYSHVVKGYY